MILKALKDSWNDAATVPNNLLHDEPLVKRIIDLPGELALRTLLTVGGLAKKTAASVQKIFRSSATVKRREEFDPLS